MKNVNENMLVKAILMSFEDYRSVVTNITGGLKIVTPECDGIFYDDSDEAVSSATFYESDIAEDLSKYFGVEVTSVHIDDCDEPGVWICYKDLPKTMYGIEITYSWGDSEGIRGSFATMNEAYKEACILAGTEAYVQNEELLWERPCEVFFDGSKQVIKLHYMYDDTWCYYKVVAIEPSGEAKSKEKLEDMIADVIQKELQYDTDYITDDGWNFLENEAKEQVLRKIEGAYAKEDISEVKMDDVKKHLADVIYEYEQAHANIRYY